jgi:hypothetical protein
MIDYVPTIHAPSISLGQKWLPTELKIEIPPSQWSEETCISRGSIFFLRVGVGAWDSLGILCSHYVPYGSIMFPPSSQYVPNMFPIAPNLIPYPLPKSSPLATYKEKPTIYLFWECPKSDHNFLSWANQGSSLPKSQKKIEHLGSPQLINTTLIKYSSQ